MRARPRRRTGRNPQGSHHRLIKALLAISLALVACSGEDAAPPPPFEPIHTSTHWWMSTTAASPTDQWIVGGTTTQGAILRFDGSTVTEVDFGADVGLLNWVHRFDDGSLIAVGTRGAVLRSPDRSSWIADIAPTDQDLWGVWGSSPSDVWAVGGSATDGRPTILRDTGTGFAPVPVPPLERPGVNVFFKVWGSGPNDVYIVGQNGAVLHWDGAGFEELGVGVGQDLIGVWGSGPDRVAVVGGRRNAVAALWDGSTWRQVDVARFSGLNGVWVDSDTAYVVGNDGTVGSIDFATAEASIEVIDTPVALHSIAGTPGGLTAVGGDFSTGPEGPFLGQVLVAVRD